MDKIDLDELEQLAAQATPGPWVGRGNHIFCADNKRLVYVEAERALDLQTAEYIVAACNSLPVLIAENRALQERAQMRQELVEQYEQDIARLRQKVRELERQRDFVLMHRIPSECLSPKDCVYLAGESPDWRCTAKLEKRKKCLEKAVARAEGETGKTADVDAEKAAKEAGE